MRSVLKNKKAEIMGMSDIFIYIIGGILVVLVVLLVFGKDWGGMIRGFLPGFNSSSDTHYDEITGSDELVYNLPADLPSYVDPNGKITGCPYFAFKVGEGLFGIYNSSGNRIGAFKKKTIPTGSWDLYDLKGVVKVYEQGKIDNSGILNQFNSYGEKYDSAINFIFNGEKIICGDSAGVNVKDSSVIISSEEYFVSQEDCHKYNGRAEYCIIKKNSTGEYKITFYLTTNKFEESKEYSVNARTGNYLGIGDSKKLCNLRVGYLATDCLAVFSNSALYGDSLNMQNRLFQKDGKFVLVNPNVISEIVEFKGSGNFEVLSDEECRSGLAQRKVDLGIPDKLCYWQAMTEVYASKCTNLDKTQISQIFEKKAEYRQLNNADWPSLSIDGDFCVPVVYDCDEWNLRMDKSGSAFGFFNPNKITVQEIDKSVEGSNLPKGVYYQSLIKKSSVSGNSAGEIQINPYYVMSKEFVLNSILIHEGLHSAQIDMANYKNTIFLPLLSEGLPPGAEGFLSTFPEEKSIIEKRDQLHNKIAAYFALKIGSLSGDSYKKEVLTYLKNSLKLVPVAFEKYISFDSPYYPLFLSDEFKTRKNNLDTYLFSEEVKKLSDLLLAYTETSKLSELDPRLSEVHRYWFDKTAPNCEILDTPEKFGNALTKFLSDTNVAEEYVITQRQLNDVLEIADKMGKRQEIWDKLIGRGPGLASNTEIDDSVLYA